MATRLHFSTSATCFDTEFGWTTSQQKDLLAAAGTAVGSLGAFSLTTTVPGFPDERPMNIPSIGIVSERVNADVTISGTIAFDVWTYAINSPGWVARLRFRIYKVTSGGSNVETLIATADATANIGVNNVDTNYTFNVTPATPVTVAGNERFLVRASLFNPGGGAVTDPGGILPQLKVAAASGAGYSWLEFTETFTTRPNLQTWYLRQTTTNGIGNFYDLTTTRGSTVKTGVVNTVASGTLIQWTRTAGGILLEWITKRFKESWDIKNAATAIGGGGTFWCHESAGQANCAITHRLYKRAADGTETLLGSNTNATEFGTSAAAVVVVPVQPDVDVALREDDRCVVRVYIRNALGLTMDAGRTCTLTYDGATGGALGDSFIRLPNLLMKEEGDPPAGETPSKLTMGGAGS